jgi:hypothetical protein
MYPGHRSCPHLWATTHSLETIRLPAMSTTRLRCTVSLQCAHAAAGRQPTYTCHVHTPQSAPCMRRAALALTHAALASISLAPPHACMRPCLGARHITATSGTPLQLTMHWSGPLLRALQGWLAGWCIAAVPRVTTACHRHTCVLACAPLLLPQMYGQGGTCLHWPAATVSGVSHTNALQWDTQPICSPLGHAAAQAASVGC